MARRQSHDRYGDENVETLPSQCCEACNADDPQVRYTHYLTLARQMDFNGIEGHLWQSFRERKSFDVDRARDTIHGLMAWIKDQVLSHTGMVDEQTGAPLPWWEGRRQTILAMRRATALKAEAADAQRLAREQNRSTYQVALMPVGTILREPGEDDLEEGDRYAAD